MEIKDALLLFLRDKRKRNILILVASVITLVSLLIYQYSHRYIPPPPGAERVVLCKKCGKTDIQRVYKIGEAKCRYCGGPVAFAWKCGKCQYEYYIIDQKFNSDKMNTLQRLQRVVEARRCPNCGEERDTHPMTLQEFKKENGK